MPAAVRKLTTATTCDVFKKKSGVLLVSVRIMKALPIAIYTRAPDVWELPYVHTCADAYLHDMRVLVWKLPTTRACNNNTPSLCTSLHALTCNVISQALVPTAPRYTGLNHDQSHGEVYVRYLILYSYR